MSAVVLLLVSSIATAFPTGAYPDCGPDNKAACPSDLGDRWHLISWIPAGSEASIRPAERAMGSGISADQAFRHTTGRFDVTVAIMDSGVVWGDGDVRVKVRLNAAELPWPRDASGTEVVGGDVDGNGVYTIADWAEDDRVTPEAGGDEAEDKLDPSDLIAIFSDGVDDDGNGYVDDIAGWDFFEHDNDPFARATDTLNYDHGTGVMKDAAAGADNGGRIGVCPNCAILPLRVGDAFITDGDRVAEAIAYAAANGVDVAGMAIGALSHGDHTKQAILDADAAGMVMVAAAGDENSWHHNFPAVEDPILYVHSIRADNQDEDQGAYSYLSTWNCNNWGPRLDLVAPGDGCATASTAVIAGSAGLLRSAGRDVGIELSPDEIKALLRMTVDDVALAPAETEEAGTYPSKEGWDTFTGYGRVNIGRAVEAVFTDAIPPVAKLSGPGWFNWVDPDVPLTLTGTADAPRGTLASWKVELGLGGDPTEWTEVLSGSTAVDGALGEVDLSGISDQVFGDLGEQELLERVERAHSPMLTFRMVVTDSDGRTTHDRMGVWAQRDETRKPGFPIDLGGSGEPAPILTDLDGDGVFEIVVGVSTGEIHVYDGTGTLWPGFPVHTTAGMASGAAVGDIDGDGDPEIVGASLDGTAWAWEADGSVLPGFPVSIVGRPLEERGPAHTWDDGIMSTPALGDIDGDGALEIVVGGLDQRLYVWRGDGTSFPGYPLELCLRQAGCSEVGARIVSSPALGDIDGDGDLDCAIGTNEVPEAAAGPLYTLDLTTATQLPASPLATPGLIQEALIPVIGEGHPGSIALADVDGDGDLELFSNPMLGTNGVIDHDATELLDLQYTQFAGGPNSNFSGGTFLAAITTPAFGDMTGDGVPDPLVGGGGIDWLVSLALTKHVDYQHAVGAWDGKTGSALPGFPRQVDDVSFLVSPTVADVSGDGRPEALYATGGYFIYAWDARGELAPGFPKFTGGWSLSGPAIGDIDGDGWLDVVATTREGDLFAWTTQGHADQKIEWASNRHDPQNTGNWHTPLPRQAGPNLPSAEDARGCCKNGDPDEAWLVLPLLLLAFRRRQ